MTTGIDVVFDATHANIGSLPPGASYAGYATGTGDVPWTTADFAKFPDAIRIAQSPNLGIDEGVHADILDVETGAATLSDCAPWAQHEIAAFKAGARKGQRSPGIYASANNITNVVNALNHGGITSGVALWLANWNLTEAAGIADVLAASGPFPIVGVQFHNAGSFDISVFSIAWLVNRAGMSDTPPPPPPPVKADVPPGQWDASQGHDWTWAAVMIGGRGLDNKEHAFDFNVHTGKWTKRQ